MLAYTLGHAGACSPRPGGVGGTEGGLIGMFAAFGTSICTAAAAVLAYRVFQLGLPGDPRRGRPAAHPPRPRAPAPREQVAARFAGYT